MDNLDGELWQHRLYILQRELEIGKLHIKWRWTSNELLLCTET